MENLSKPPLNTLKQVLIVVTRHAQVSDSSRSQRAVHHVAARMKAVIIQAQQEGTTLVFSLSGPLQAASQQEAY
jgi:hypothetical protein